jgi:hypothetical protein
LEFGTDKPLAGAMVYLVSYGGSFLGPVSGGVIDSARADSDGAYRFDNIDNALSLYTHSLFPGYFQSDLHNAGNVRGKHNDNADLA